MTRFPGFVGPTYRAASGRAERERCVNLFLESIESGKGANGEQWLLRAVAGLRRLATIGTGPIRGVYAAAQSGALYVVSGEHLYKVGDDWGAKSLGTLLTDSGPCDMADNGVELLVVDGHQGYLVTLASNAFKRLGSEAFAGSDRASFVGGYFLCNHPATGQFFISGLYDGSSWDALDYATAESLPDNLLCAIGHGGQAWMFGARSVEVYYLSGGTFPFARIDGSMQDFGCASPHVPQRLAGALVWLTDRGQVRMSNGYQSTRISNHAVETAMREAGDLSGATAWTYEQDGHCFYCLNVPGISTTWCFDVASGQWTEMGEWDAGYLRHRAACGVHAYALNLVGDYQDGRLYALDPEAHTFDGAPLVWERTAPHVVSSGANIALAALQVEMETGVGLDHGAQGSDPQVMLQVSRDGGNLWGPERWKTLGRIGDYRRRVIFRQLGQGRDFVIRLRGSEPVQTVILGATLEVA